MLAGRRVLAGHPVLTGDRVLRRGTDRDEFSLGYRGVLCRTGRRCIGVRALRNDVCGGVVA
ncbi:hypothetical protein GCM10025867_25650 [Frondihabitans sucicola]|uniref:Uncharacterized protein n=1 Tax=Frondihabitans sucicola TaxID=1268041 RepID=A0ABN6XZ56_9MICO|nr:hypothetical protein GCM10025867_25650 [Frondihabitans sucicola]